MVKELNYQKTNVKQYETLRECYPTEYLYIMQGISRTDLVYQYKAECKEWEQGDHKKYSRYIHGFWQPHLSELRQAGKIYQGKYFTESNREPH